jgi:hypothetical protein
VRLIRKNSEVTLHPIQPEGRKLLADLDGRLFAALNDVPALAENFFVTFGGFLGKGGLNEKFRSRRSRE